MKKIFSVIACAMCATTIATAQTSVAESEYALTDYNYKHAMELESENKIYDAIAEMQKSIEKNPTAALPYFKIAKLYNYFSDTEKVFQENLSKAVEFSEKSDPSMCANVLLWRSYYYSVQGNMEAAFADAKKAYGICKGLKMTDENKGAGCLAMGNYYGNMGDFETSVRYLREYLSMDPFDNITRTKMLLCLINAGTDESLAEAKQVVADGLALNGAHQDILSRKATIAIAEGDLGAAAEIVVSQLAKCGPDNSDADITKNWTDILDRDATPLLLQQKGKMAANPMVSTWPQLLGMAYAYKSIGNNALAAEYFNKSYGITGSLRDLYYVITYREKAGDLDGALNAIETYLAKDTTTAIIYGLRAEINSMLNKKETVLADYSKAISLAGERNNGDYYYQRAWFEQYNGMAEEAVLDMTTAIQKDDDNAHYYYTRGQILASLDENEMAREDFEQSRDVAKAHLESEHAKENEEYAANEHQHLAFALFRLGDEAGALSEVEKGLQTTDKSGALYNKVCILSLMGKKDEAIKTLSEAIDAGYDGYVHMGRDFDLDNIRGMKEFGELVAKAKANAEGKNNVAKAAAKSEASGEPAVVEVSFSKNRGGTLSVPCTVNGLPLTYIFDSGAADVTISLVEANFMLRNGYLKKSDIGDRMVGSGADGGLIGGTTINIRSITFGGVTLKDVKATIIETQTAPLLMGQTAMNRYGTATIDYDKGVIRLARNVK